MNFKKPIFNEGGLPVADLTEFIETMYRAAKRLGLCEKPFKKLDLYVDEFIDAEIGTGKPLGPFLAIKRGEKSTLTMFDTDAEETMLLIAELTGGIK